MVAFDKDVIFSLIKSHPTPIRRVLFVGVHLDLCILYSRWFSILRVAKFWGLDEVQEFGLISNLLDMSTYNTSRPMEMEKERDQDKVKDLACWVKCEAAPSFLGDGAKPVTVYDFI
jgi:hypothetical protein